MMTPLAPWKNVIPQLFPRLHHQSEFVSSQVCELLCRLASNYPHLIMYPAITEKNNEPEMKSNMLMRIVSSLQKSIVNEISAWINELQRITVLWSEIWIHGLGKVLFNSRAFTS